MRRWIAALLLGLLAVPTLAGRHAPEDADRFDESVLHRIGGRIGVELQSVEQLGSGDPLRLGWESFRNAYGGSWKILVDERTGMPTLVKGSGVPLFENGQTPSDLATVDASLRAFLYQNRDALGNFDISGLELDLDASGQFSPDHWQLIFRQRVDGVRVENARFDFHVKHGRLVLFGAAYWGSVKTAGVPTLPVGVARAILDDHIDASSLDFVQSGEPELVLLAGEASASGLEPSIWTGKRGEGLDHTLVWRFRFYDPHDEPLWVGEVDAHAGIVRSFYDDSRAASIRGGVFPESADADCANGGCEVDNFPMPYADWTETGQAEMFADAYGNYACVNAMETFETNLSGPYVNIVDSCGAMSETAVCGDGLELGLKYGTNCDTDPAGTPGNNAAARTTYFHMNRIFETARYYDGTSPWLTAQLPVEVNQPGSCNAFWRDPEISMLGAGSNCNNTGELSGVLVHEWGHGYDFNDGGGEDVPSEAYADVVATLYNRSSCMSRGWYNDGTTCSGYGDTCLTCSGIRDMDWAARVNNTPATPSNFTIALCPSGPGGPCNKEAHCESYVISETIFDLATRDLPAAGMDPDTAWQLVERLWYSTRLGAGGDIYDCFRYWLAHSCFSNSWMQRMLVADDDDGDLANGTPHAAEIYAAFDRHEISCGSAGDPENQSTSSCPSLTTPALSLVETGSGTELSWPAVANADEIRVYRNERGCDLSQVPIATLAGTAMSFVDAEADQTLPRYYRVEAFGASAACHSPVSNCESTPLSARVQPLDFDIVETGTVNGIPDPGETVQLPVTAFNAGLDATSGTVATLTFIDPAQGTVLDGSATFANVPPSGTVQSDAPHFEVEVADTVTCGDTVNWRVVTSATNSVAASKRFGVVLGEKDREFENDVTATLPAQTTMPHVSQFVLTDDEVIAEIDVYINIGHDHAEELIVELTSPEGTTVRLHDRTTSSNQFSLSGWYDSDETPDGPGTMADFAGESSAGTWELSVEDLGTVSTIGQLNPWKLFITSQGAFDCEEAGCSAPTPTEAPGGLTVGKSGTDLDFAWNAVTVADGYNVLQTTDSTFASGVTLTGATTGTALTLTGGVTSTPALTFFQVRATNACGDEGP